MKINRDNYEHYFLDHAEGNLSPEMERELFIFLEANPDLKNVLEDFDASPLPPAEIKNDNLKKRLKKNIRPTLHINEAHVDEWLIRDVEGLLSQTESDELDEFLALNPAYKYDQKLFRLTKAEPDQTITFSRKNQLKKKAPVLIFTRVAWTVSAAAAVILLLIGIRFFNQPEVIENPHVIQTEAKPVAVSPATEVTPSASRGTPTQETPTQETPTQKTPVQVTPTRMTTALQMAPLTAEAVNIKVSAVYEEYSIAALHNLPVQTVERKEKTLVAKLFSNLVADAGKAIRNNANIGNIKKDDLNLWSIAEAGVKGFNTISDRDLELMVKRDEDGNIKSYALVEEDRLLLTRSLDNN